MALKTITFSCETITPMFLSGADGSTPELRPPSIKGALRFWWRAMNGHLSLEELKEKEDYIFGGSGNRSKVLITNIKHDEIIESYEEFDHTFFTYDGNNRRYNGKAFPTNAMYYLGYGVANWVKEEKKTRFVRPYIPAGLNFSITLKVQEEIENELINSFKAVEQFGGLGSKTRNAYGGFRIIKTVIDNKEVSIDAINLDQFNKIKTKSYTTFSEKILLLETKKTNYKKWEEAFKEICEVYQHARENVDYWHEYERRELIAMPIVVKGEREMNANFLERHAKPYFMHISKSNKGYKGEILLLPYNYLEKITGEDLKRVVKINGESLDTLKSKYFKALEAFNDLLKTEMNVITKK